MCARYTLRRYPADYSALFGVSPGQWMANLGPRYNIAPSQPVPVVLLSEAGGVTLRLVKWGLVPHWAKDPSVGAKMINARIESADEKPSFRDAVKYRRCLVPADGFYEWTAAHDGGRQPWFIHRRDDRLLAFAGLWEHWQDPAGNELETCAILTTAAQTPISDLHPRMPVMLDPDQSAFWVRGSSGSAALQRLRAVPMLADITLHRVDRRVNRPAVDDPQCVAPIDLQTLF